MEVNNKELAKFIVKAKVQTYAVGGEEISPQRPGFKEMEFQEGDFEYRDSYSGFFFAPGQEVVRWKGKPVWTMAYSGGMNKKYHGDVEFALKVFNFLKECLKLVSEDKPFRGSEKFEEGDFEYVSEVEGDVEDFNGVEKIYYKKEEVFRQVYSGGIIVGK